MQNFACGLQRLFKTFLVTSGYKLPMKGQFGCRFTLPVISLLPFFVPLLINLCLELSYGRLSAHSRKIKQVSCSMKIDLFSKGF